MKNSIRKPDFFIAGAPKCGTTSLYHYLKGHPDIFMPTVKEPHFFSSDLHYHIHLYRSEQEYLKLFRGAGNVRRAGEASVSYISSKQAPHEMKRMTPDAKIIILLRQPADQIYSFHQEVAFRGRAPANFQEALQRQKDGDQLHYLNMVKHWPEAIRTYKELFGAESVKVIIFDDFISDTAAIFKEVLEFLEVDSSYRPEFPIYNESTAPRSRMVSKVLTLPWVIALGRFVFTTVPYGNRLDMFQFNRKSAPREDLGNSEWQRLTDIFIPTIQALESELSVDLSVWYKKQVKVWEGQ